MAQDANTMFLFYFLLFIYHNASAGAVPVREGPKKDLECRGCFERQIKREMEGLLSKGMRSKYVKNLSDVRKYSYNRGNPGGYSYLLLKGWGAGGMPFNVLYTPNIHQKKILKSVQRKTTEKGMRNMPEIYDLVLEEKPPQKNTERTPKKQLIPRKYYSLIPQLFVSYGW